MARNLNTEGKKRAFIWGMAIHSAADVFAHSAFVKVDKIWRHLAHGTVHNGVKINNYADNTGRYKERFEAAQNVVSKMVQKYDAKNGGGSYMQFTAASSVGTTFKLKDFIPFILQTNSNADVEGLYAYSIVDGPFDYWWVGL